MRDEICRSPTLHRRYLKYPIAEPPGYKLVMQQGWLVAYVDENGVTSHDLVWIDVPEFECA